MIIIPCQVSSLLTGYRWVTNLTESFRKADLEVVSDETLSSPDHLQPISSLSWIIGIEEHRYRQTEAGELERLQEQLMEEAKAGAFMDVKYTLVVGRKRLEG
jgi:hypothetical protein